MLKTTGLVAGHYECRSLDATLPVFTELLAMEVVERKAGEATLKHPNTDWRLIMHEGGPNAPEKTFDNHYGFRVATHEEVEAAWKYIEAHKDKYRLSKITKPQSAHFAYSIYFREPGGNHLEIEYYNPGGALHGRSHTAGHWENPLTVDRFPGRVEGRVLTVHALPGDFHRRAKHARVDHLRSHRPLPDQLVETKIVALDGAFHR